MRGIVETMYVESFLVDKGFARTQGEPFVYTHLGPPVIVLTIDEEHSWQDLNFLIANWIEKGASDFAAEFLSWIEREGHEKQFSG